MYASSGNKHFFTKSCHSQTYQNYEQSQQKLGTILGIIPTGQGRNQPLYERHMTKSGQNRVNTNGTSFLMTSHVRSALWTLTLYQPGE